ncbi:hypothetical protein [Rhizobium sp. J15]|uniref:hypothetical protein n=1 Tax=Rhizobium sp. J15 TaxID=2035450 RepID=UPI0011435577|nr:hypothetical protein [Rhizobium sp. J15]
MLHLRFMTIEGRAKFCDDQHIPERAHRFNVPLQGVSSHIGRVLIFLHGPLEIKKAQNQILRAERSTRGFAPARTGHPVRPGEQHRYCLSIGGKHVVPTAS